MLRTMTKANPVTSRDTKKQEGKGGRSYVLEQE